MKCRKRNTIKASIKMSKISNSTHKEAPGRYEKIKKKKVKGEVKGFAKVSFIAIKGLLSTESEA